MSNSLIYLETGSTNPFYNLAFEEILLSRQSEHNYLLLWQNENTVVVGQNQNTVAEINQQFIKQHGIRVVRRKTGGGAVYHDLGNLNYSFISNINNKDWQIKGRFTDSIVAALQNLNLDAKASGRNDILISGYKVSGTAQCILGNRILHHGTLLFDSDIQMMTGALQVDSLKFESKSIQSLRSRVGNIRGFLHNDMTLPQFWAYLKQELLGSNIIMDNLSEVELSTVKALQENKYNTWEWNYGKSPEYKFKNKRKWPGGLLEVQFTVTSGRITNIAFYGDFLSVFPLDVVECALQGCRLQEDDVKAVLDQYSLYYYFGEITRDEILETLFQGFQ